MKKVDKEIKEASAKDAKALRQYLVARFDELLKENVPDAKKGSGRFWTMSLSDTIYFYVTFEFPKWLEGDSTFSIFYGIENKYTKATENMSVRRERYISYPYGIHHQLFEFDNVAWNKDRVGYLYWKLLMQSKKNHYYTHDQAEYVASELFPYAIREISKEYAALRRKYEGSTKSLPDLRVKKE